MPTTTGERFERAVSIMARLRGEGGCPWDREQTFDSIKPYTIEEAYEVLEAIDNRDWDELPAELGDLLLQVLFYAQMAKDDGKFSIDQVLDRLSTKLVNRHPHVFGDVTAETSAEVLRNWEALKVEEKNKRGGKAEAADGPESVLAGVSTAMPALLEAYKLSLARPAWDLIGLTSKAYSTSSKRKPVNCASTSRIFPRLGRVRKGVASPARERSRFRRA